MSYLIISIYDSAINFSVCENGKVLDADEEREYDGDGYGEEVKPYLYIYNNYHRYRDYKKEYAKLNFDLIILCEDGDIEVLKNE